MLIILFSVNFPVVSGEAVWQLFYKFNILQYFTIIVTLPSPPPRWLRAPGHLGLSSCWTGRTCCWVGCRSCHLCWSCYRAGAAGCWGGPWSTRWVILSMKDKFLFLNYLVVIRSGLCFVYWPGLLHHTWWSVLSPGYGPRPGGSRLSSLLLSLAGVFRKQ